MTAAGAGKVELLTGIDGSSRQVRKILLRRSNRLIQPGLRSGGT